MGQPGGLSDVILNHSRKERILKILALLVEKMKERKSSRGFWVLLPKMPAARSCLWIGQVHSRGNSLSL